MWLSIDQGQLSSCLVLLLDISLVGRGSETDDHCRNPNINTEIIYWATN